MRRLWNEEILLSLTALALAGVAPNLFPAAQAGLAPLSLTGKVVLLPSVVLLALLTWLAHRRGHRRLVNRLLAGMGAGVAATLALEVVRATSFRLGGMPGDMPRLLGVLLTDRFMTGPSLASDLLGWAYHFWNGAAFGLIFTVVLGRRSLRWAEGYGQLIGLGFLLSPAVASLGIGFLGLEMPAMPLTVVLAHAAYSLVLGGLTRRWVRDAGWLLAAPHPAEGRRETTAVAAGC